MLQFWPPQKNLSQLMKKMLSFFVSLKRIVSPIKIQHGMPYTQVSLRSIFFQQFYFVFSDISYGLNVEIIDNECRHIFFMKHLHTWNIYIQTHTQTYSNRNFVHPKFFITMHLHSFLHAWEWFLVIFFFTVEYIQCGSKMIKTLLVKLLTHRKLFRKQPGRRQWIGNQ